MSTRIRLAAVVLCAGGIATIASAQPTVNEDLDTVQAGTTSRPIAVTSGQLTWFKLTIPDVAAGTAGPGSVYLDIRTAEPGGAAITDTEIALYSASGVYASGANATSWDDDDGPGTGSALSYGMKCPTRVNPGAGTQSNGVVFDGRDGGLPAGEYYLVVAPYNSTFATNWGVTPGTASGGMTLEVTLGIGSEPVPAPAMTAGAATAALAGETMVVTATSTACGAATSAVLDTSALGGSPSVTMYDDGTHGDAAAGNNVWTAVITVPAAAAPGAYDLVVTGSNGSGSAIRTITATVMAPPATLAASGGVYTEIEDNEGKVRANRIASMSPGEAISGATTGTSTSAVGAANSADYFRVTVAPAAPGIYRNRLVITTSGNTGHTGTIRGLGQSDGAITAGGDVEIQGTSTTTTPARFNQWYGFGKGETLYYRVTGTTSTTGNYTATLSSEPVTPVDLGTFAPGELVITTVGQGHTTDTDLWVYDGQLNAIPGYGNDDESPAEGGADTAQSRLVRTYAPGTYYLMLSNWNTANDQPSPATDDYRAGNVTDFPNLAVNNSTTTYASMQFAVTDANGTQSFAASKPAAFEVYWATFTVGAPGPTCGPADFNGDGDVGTDQDIEAFFACLGGNCCPACWEGGADFNGDGDVGTDQDIEAYFRILGGGAC